MTIAEASDIRDILNDTFDSHDFISEYISRFPSSYGELLIKHNSAHELMPRLQIFSAIILLNCV